jgi:hypothetical protein
MDTFVVLDRHTRREHRVAAMQLLRLLPRLRFDSEAEARKAFSKACVKLLVPRG